MKVTVKHWNAVAQWRWDTRSTTNNSSSEHQETTNDDGEDDLCGICRVAFEACCPSCKTPGDDCPLSAYNKKIISC